MMSFKIKTLLVALLGWSGAMLQAKELPSHQGFITVPGEELYYQQVGILSKNKLPLVVLHGGPGMDQSYLLPQLLKLAQDREVIFYDQRGAGKSSAHPLNPDQITLERYVKDLEEVRHYFGFQKMILLGHSWGALLAAEYAVNHPQHVDGLIFLNAVPMTSRGYELFQHAFAQRMIPLQKQLNALQESAPFQQGDPKATADFYRLLFSSYCARPQDADKISLCFTSTSALRAPKIEEIFATNLLTRPYNVLPQLHQCSIPTLIIHGAQDPVPVATALETKQAMPQAMMVVLDPCGHFSYIEQSKKCFEAIQKFLKTL